MYATTTSNKTLVLNRKNSTEGTYRSNRKFERKSSIKKVQLEIKINLSAKFNEIEPTSPYSQSITFRLNSLPPTTPQENEAKIFTSEFYFNPKLAEKIHQFQPTLHVDLSYCYLTDLDIPIITHQVILEKKCTELWLYGNEITAKGAGILASSLIQNSTLKSLDLSFNQISDLGVRALTEALLPEQNSSLQILYLSKNRISNDGGKYLSEMLRTNQTLRELWLSNNEIGNEGVQQLAHVLAYQNKTLKVLSLSVNVFLTDLCIDYLIEMLEQNQTLRKLWMKDCNLTEQGKRKLQEIADRKKKFQIDL